MLTFYAIDKSCFARNHVVLENFWDKDLSKSEDEINGKRFL